MMQYVYQKFDFNEAVKIDVTKYQTLSMKLQSSYRDNLYHTSVHAGDVL